MKDVLDWKPPQNVSEIHSFLGLAGYYRRFIQDFSKITKPMTKLLEKGREFKWSNECQASFEELRRRLTSAPILVFPDITQSFDMYCDASRQGLGCVFMKEEKVVSFASRQLRNNKSTI